MSKYKKDYNKFFRREKVIDNTVVNTSISEQNVGTSVLDTTTLKTSPAPEPVKAKVVNCHRLNVRRKPDISSPNISSPIICILNAGDIVAVEEVRGGWAHIYTAAGIEGYVVSDYIQNI